MAYLSKIMSFSSKKEIVRKEVHMLFGRLKWNWNQIFLVSAVLMKLLRLFPTPVSPVTPPSLVAPPPSNPPPPKKKEENVVLRSKDQASTWSSASLKLPQVEGGIGSLKKQSISGNKKDRNSMYDSRFRLKSLQNSESNQVNSKLVISGKSSKRWRKWTQSVFSSSNRSKMAASWSQKLKNNSCQNPGNLQMRFSKLTKDNIGSSYGVTCLWFEVRCLIFGRDFCLHWEIFDDMNMTWHEHL